jgi:GrpB-like predicted nucleotidyltransferase (UPF0157 family)
MQWNPDWPAAFEAEAVRIMTACGKAILSIEHIGSTSIPGIAAKPIVDLMAATETLQAAEALEPVLAKLGYEYVSRFNHLIPERRYYRRPLTLPRTHHLHITTFDSNFWIEHLRFRDALRADDRLRDEYEELKRQLSDRYADDIDAYTDGKTAFIRRISRPSWTAGDV